MITYDSNHFGLLQVAKLNGSAVYRTVIPSTMSTLILLVYKHTFGDNESAQQLKDDKQAEGYEGSSMSYFEGHPIVIGIYIVAFSLILNHRLNYCYQRYWESCGNLFLMTSKWIDSATTLASFHYQSLVYEESRPCSFGDDRCVDENGGHNSKLGPPCGGNDRTAARPAANHPVINEIIDDYDYEYDDEDDDCKTDSSSSASSSPSVSSPSSSSHNRAASSASFVSHDTRERHRTTNNSTMKKMKRSLRSSHSSNNRTSSSISSVTAGVNSERNSDDNDGGILRRMFFWNNSKSKSNTSDNNNIPMDSSQRDEKKEDNSSSFFFLDVPDNQQTTVNDDRLSGLSSSIKGSTNNKMQLSSSMPSISGGGGTMNKIQSSAGRWNKFNKGPSMSTTSSNVSFATDVDKIYGSNKNGNAFHSKNNRKSISLKKSSSNISGGTRRSSNSQRVSGRKSGRRRLPSTDLPVPGDNNVVKSFKPNPSLAWQKCNHVAMPRNTGLHATVIENFNVNGEQFDFEKLLLQDKKERKEEQRERQKLVVQELKEQNGQTPRRASLPIMNFDLKRATLTGMLGTGTINPNRKKFRSSEQLDQFESLNKEELDDDEKINKSSRSSNSASNYKYQRYSLFPMPELFDLPSLHKKQQPPGGLGGGSGRDVSGSNRSHLTSSMGSSSHYNSNNEGQQQLQQPPVENMNGRASLFLQEAAHLFSLMSAVAMSSLRADMEGISSPLVDYVPGQKFPPVNPEEMQIQILVKENESDDNFNYTDENSSSNNNNNNISGQDESHRSTESNTTQQRDNATIRIKRNNAYTNIFLFLFGMSRNARQRTIYNASRPFSVLGGISDQEVEMLRKVRGPAAQHALCTFWLKEFITREHLNGSTGNIAPPIMARVYQYISDGTQQYNQCRKTAFTDFPFPHAQLTSFFILVSIFVFPLLYYQYVTDVWIAMALNFLTTSCFVGIQEVAMELEEPFVRYPNDLPLNNYQAQFNEALISSLYGGFHPDSWGHTYDNGGIFKMGGDWEDGGADGVRDNHGDGDNGDIDGGRNFSTIDNLSSTRSILKTSSYSMRNTEGSGTFVE